MDLWCACCCVVDAEVLPHLYGWVESCYEEFWSLGCPNCVASLWDSVDFLSIVAFEFYDSVGYAFVEKSSVVQSDWMVVLIVVGELGFRDEFLHGCCSVLVAGAAEGVA